MTICSLPCARLQFRLLLLLQITYKIIRKHYGSLPLLLNGPKHPKLSLSGEDPFFTV